MFQCRFAKRCEMSPIGRWVQRAARQFHSAAHNRCPLCHPHRRSSAALGGPLPSGASRRADSPSPSAAWLWKRRAGEPRLAGSGTAYPRQLPPGPHEVHWPVASSTIFLPLRHTVMIANCPRHWSNRKSPAPASLLRVSSRPCGRDTRTAAPRISGSCPVNRESPPP